MNSDDEKRLAEIRAEDIIYTEDARWLIAIIDSLRAKLDESERARAQQMTDRDEWREVARDWKSRATKAEAALAEERAKREASTEALCDERRVWSELEEALRLRAEAAEARVAELEALLDDYRQRVPGQY